MSGTVVDDFKSIHSSIPAHGFLSSPRLVDLEDRRGTGGVARHGESIKETELYERKLLVRCCSSNIEDRVSTLTVKVFMSSNSQSSGSQHSGQRILTVQITDEMDAFFLYTLQVSEADFHALKKEQSILVDFAAFPSKFTELLDLCIQSADQNPPKFMALLSLSRNNAAFSIVETNQFKHLQHLSLQFVKGNDETIKKYLAGRLDHFKSLYETSEKGRISSSDTCDELRSRLSHLSDKVKELERKERNTENELRISHKAEMTEMKQKILRERDEMRGEYEGQLRTITNEHNQEVRKLQAKLDSAQAKKDELTKSKYNIENSLRNANLHVNGFQENLRLCKSQLATAKDENQRLHGEVDSLTTEVNEKSRRVAALEQEVKGKEDMIQSLNALLKSERQQNTNLEESLRLFRSNNEENEKRVRDCGMEINKGNEVISRLQSELRTTKAKAKAKTAEIAQHQQTIEQKRLKLMELEKKFDDIAQMISKTETENKNLHRQLEHAKEDISRKDKQMLQNKTTIEWLTKEWNEAKLSGLSKSTNPIVSPSHSHPQDVSAVTVGSSTPFSFQPSMKAYSSFLSPSPIPSSSQQHSSRMYDMTSISEQTPLSSGTGITSHHSRYDQHQHRYSSHPVSMTNTSMYRMGMGSSDATSTSFSSSSHAHTHGRTHGISPFPSDTTNTNPNPSLYTSHLSTSSIPSSVGYPSSYFNTTTNTTGSGSSSGTNADASSYGHKKYRYSDRTSSQMPTSKDKLSSSLPRMPSEENRSSLSNTHKPKKPFVRFDVAQ